MDVGIRELRNNLSALLERVRKGEQVIVTDRGHPIAKLTAVAEADALERLVADKLIRPAEEPKQPTSATRKANARGSVSDLVREQRR